MHVKMRCSKASSCGRGHCFASSVFRNLGLCPGENSSRHLNENSCLHFRAMTVHCSE